MVVTKSSSGENRTRKLAMCHFLAQKDSHLLYLQSAHIKESFHFMLTFNNKNI